MRVFHVESGLGNQMLDYCDLLASRKMNPKQLHYIENIIFDIAECDSVIKQWNGYELERIFGIKEANIKDLFDESEWRNIISEIKQSEFWNNNWNFPSVFVDVFNAHGLRLNNQFCHCMGIQKGFKHKLRSLKMYQKIKRMISRFKSPKELRPSSFLVTEEDTFGGHSLAFMYKGGGINEIEDEVKRAFHFPTSLDDKNYILKKEIMSRNSVSLHIRRGDGLKLNQRYYESGYYRRAVKFISKRIRDVHFYIFADPGTMRWVAGHSEELGLTNKKKIYVDWNKGIDSYKDMELMAACKHNIISYSSFSWWASYLNENPKKITISPEPKILTTNWM